MPAMRIVRPVVRSFRSPYAKEAAAHVRAGGHALVWEAPKRVRLVFGVPKGDEEKDLGYWSLLDLGVHRWKKETAGPLKGLAVARIAQDSIDLVKARAERDSVHPRATRAMKLDCETCAACCRDNEVVLEEKDLERFAEAGRKDLTKRPYTRKDGDRVILTLLRSKDCRHLQKDRRCGIYALRPESCRVFPMGSESCLYSREVELGIVDGVAG
jgi:Fe-S-cluster containining protein